MSNFKEALKRHGFWWSSAHRGWVMGSAGPVMSLEVQIKLIERVPPEDLPKLVLMDATSLNDYMIDHGVVGAKATTWLEGCLRPFLMAWLEAL